MLKAATLLCLTVTMVVFKSVGNIDIELEEPSLTVTMVVFKLDHVRMYDSYIVV